MPVDDATVVGVFQSTRPARGATKDNQPFVPAFTISIHAPREGRDARRTAPPHARNHFNPRAPRGARHDYYKAGNSKMKFQSTRPARGATVNVGLAFQPPRLFQSTRPARGATYNDLKREFAGRNFNPRAPRGARPATPLGAPQILNFNPRAPRGARLRPDLIV